MHACNVCIYHFQQHNKLAAAASLTKKHWHIMSKTFRIDRSVKSINSTYTEDAWHQAGQSALTLRDPGDPAWLPSWHMRGDLGTPPNVFVGRRNWVCQTRAEAASYVPKGNEQGVSLPANICGEVTTYVCAPAQACDHPASSLSSSNYIAVLASNEGHLP